MNLLVDKTELTDIDKIKEILVDSGYYDLYIWSDSPGTFYSWHTHPDDEIRWVISGSIVIGYEKGEVELTPGDRIDVKAGTKHWAESDMGVSYICASI